MGESDREIVVTFQAPAGWMESRRVTRLAGEELPAEVTAQPVTIGVYNTTEGVNEDGRPFGWVAYSLNIGGRANPLSLTQDEREYVARMLEHAVSDFRSGHAFDGGSLPPSEQPA